MQVATAVLIAVEPQQGQHMHSMYYKASAMYILDPQVLRDPQVLLLHIWLMYTNPTILCTTVQITNPTTPHLVHTPTSPSPHDH